MNRFREPTASDELAACSTCGEQHHHESMHLVGDDYYCEQNDCWKGYQEKQAESAQ